MSFEEPYLEMVDFSSKNSRLIDDCTVGETGRFDLNLLCILRRLAFLELSLRSNLSSIVNCEDVVMVFITVVVVVAVVLSVSKCGLEDA